MSKIFVVVRGGRSHEAAKSHEFGQLVLNILKKHNKKTHDLYYQPNGSFTLDGMPVIVQKVLPTFDLVYIALVGADGESGYVSKLCEDSGVKFIGHSNFHSTLAHDKDKFKKTLKQHGVKSPYSQHLSSSENSRDEALKVYGTVGIPAMLKPNKSSGKNGVHIAGSYSEIESHIEKLFKQGEDALAEVIIKGLHFTVLVSPLEDGTHTYIHLDREVSDDKLLSEIDSYTEAAKKEALYIHNILSFEDQVAYDFVVNKRGVYLLEANTHPNLLDQKYYNFHKDEKFNFEKYLINKIAEKFL